MPSENRDWQIARHAGLEQGVKSVLILQCAATLIALLTIVGTGLLVGDDMTDCLARVKAAAYGAILAISGTLLSARSVRRSTDAKYQRPDAGLAPVSIAPIFSGVVNKLVIVGGGIALGLIALELSPIHLVSVYLIVQIAGASQLLMYNK